MARAPGARSSSDPLITPRTPLRDQVRHILLERMINAELAADERITETALATELGVSRTPLREALLELQRASFITSETAPSRNSPVYLRFRGLLTIRSTSCRHAVAYRSRVSTGGGHVHAFRTFRLNQGRLS